MTKNPLIDAETVAILRGTAHHVAALSVLIARLFERMPAAHRARLMPLENDFLLIDFGLAAKISGIADAIEMDSAP